MPRKPPGRVENLAAVSDFTDTPPAALHVRVLDIIDRAGSLADEEN
jgi:hypothetical protein